MDACESPAAVVAIAQRVGYSFDEDELFKTLGVLRQAKEGALDESELDRVAGGIAIIANESGFGTHRVGYQTRASRTLLRGLALQVARVYRARVAHSSHSRDDGSGSPSLPAPSPFRLPLPSGSLSLPAPSPSGRGLG